MPGNELDALLQKYLGAKSSAKLIENIDKIRELAENLKNVYDLSHLDLKALSVAAHDSPALKLEGNTLTLSIPSGLKGFDGKTPAVSFTKKGNVLYCSIDDDEKVLFNFSEFVEDLLKIKEATQEIERQAAIKAADARNAQEQASEHTKAAAEFLHKTIELRDLEFLPLVERAREFANFEEDNPVEPNYYGTGLYSAKHWALKARKWFKATPILKNHINQLKTLADNIDEILKVKARSEQVAADTQEAAALKKETKELNEQTKQEIKENKKENEKLKKELEQNFSTKAQEIEKKAQELEKNVKARTGELEKTFEKQTAQLEKDTKKNADKTAEIKKEMELKRQEFENFANETNQMIDEKASEIEATEQEIKAAAAKCEACNEKMDAVNKTVQSFDMHAKILKKELLNDATDEIKNKIVDRFWSDDYLKKRIKSFIDDAAANETAEKLLNEWGKFLDPLKEKLSNMDLNEQAKKAFEKYFKEHTADMEEFKKLVAEFGYDKIYQRFLQDINKLYEYYENEINDLKQRLPATDLDQGFNKTQMDELDYLIPNNKALNEFMEHQKNEVMQNIEYVMNNLRQEFETLNKNYDDALKGHIAEYTTTLAGLSRQIQDLKDEVSRRARG